MLQLLRGSKEDNEISFECQDDDLFSEEEEETHVEKVKQQRGDEEDELKEEVVRGQDTGIDVYSLGESISTIQLFSFQFLIFCCRKLLPINAGRRTMLSSTMWLGPLHVAGGRRQPILQDYGQQAH